LDGLPGEVINDLNEILVKKIVVTNKQQKCVLIFCEERKKGNFTGNYAQRKLQ